MQMMHVKSTTVLDPDPPRLTPVILLVQWGEAVKPIKYRLQINPKMKLVITCTHL